MPPMPPGQSGLGVNMGGVLVDNRQSNMQPQMDYTYQQDLRGGQKVQRRPSTNKMSHDQNSAQNPRMMAPGSVGQSAISISNASIAQNSQ